MRNLWWIPVLAVLAFLSLHSLPEAFTDLTIGGGGYWMCMDYVKEGTLYGGQPYCAQAPIIYYLSYVLSLAVGETNLLTFLALATVFAEALTYLLLARTLKNKGHHNPIVYTLLFLLFVYRFTSFMTSTLATSFLFFAYYFLYTKNRGYTAGLFLSLAVFTKYTVLAPALTLFAYYWISRDKAETYKAAVAAAASLTLLLIFFPHMPEYSFTAHRMLLEKNPLEGVTIFLSNHSTQSLAAAVITAALAHAYRRGHFKKAPEHLLAASSMILYSLLFIVQFGHTRFGDHYMLPAYPFLCATYLMVFPHSKKLFTLLFLVTFLYPTIYGPETYASPLVSHKWHRFETQKSLDAKKTIEYGIHYIPHQDGKTLTEYVGGHTPIIEEYNLSLSEVEVIPAHTRSFPQFEDQLWGPNLRKLVDIHLPHSMPYQELTDAEKEIKQKLLAGDYSLIIAAPPYWASTERILDATQKYLIENYCIVFAPNFEYMGSGRPFTALFFRNNTHCEHMIKDMTDYYIRKHDTICALGPRALYTVHNATSMNNIKLPKQPCTPPKEYPYLPKNKHKTRTTDLLIIAALYLPTYLIVKKLPDDLHQ